ncbi:Lsm2p [Malassezia vespertilionis]|uniref:Lsm2p n=1 Tax=Malassezia vespertilionis TaxID=2020962 RepID=A0A2N1JCI1_9BASI|nr:Lsm2p [Malassezia vespertilionis]
MFSAFKTLTGQTVTVELKNDLAIQGTLKSVDQFLNFKLDDIKFAVKSTFIRGSVVRFVYIPAAAVDTQLLEDATRREAETQTK